MANQENSYTGNQGSGTGNAFFDFTFPTFSESEIKVEVDDVVKTLTTHYTVENYNATSGGKVKFTTNNIPTGSTPVRIFRQTDVDSAKAVFTAGSSLKAGEINNNFTQVLRGLQEAIGANATDRKVQNFNIADHAITSVKIKDGTIVEADLANSAVTSNKIADNAVTTTEILNGAVTRAKLEADAVDGTKLADNAVDSEHYTDGSINHEHLNGDCVDGDNIQDNAINSEHYVDGSIDRIHLEADIIDASKIEDDAVGTEHIAADGVRTGNIQNDAVTIDKIADAVIVTSSEQAAHTVDDNTFFTTSAAEARYFNASTGETIKNGQAFPDNDTTIATTAAINDRIIDIVDDIGGFVPLVDEGEIPQYHPEKANAVTSDRVGTILSIGTLTTTYTPSGGTVTIAASDLTNHSVNATITDCGSTVLSAGFGVLVETKAQTDSQYAAGPSFKFHRLVPKATEVTTVAGKATEVTTVHTNINSVNTVATNISDINTVAADATDIGAVAAKATEIGRLGTADAVADMALLGTADCVADMNTLGTADVVADLNTLGTADVVADMNMLATTDVVSDMNALATTNNITAMDTCRDNIASINNCSTNISSVNTFGDQYQVNNSDPSADGGGNQLAPGDLYFNTSANELKVYNGSSWQGGVTATGNFATVTGNIFTGDNRYNDGVKAKFGTDSDFQAYHDNTNAYLMNQTGTLRIRGNDIRLQDVNGETYIKNTQNGSVELYHDNSKKLETTATGILLEDSSSKTTAPLRIQNLNSSGVCTNPKLEFYGRTVIGQGSIPYIQSVHGTEAGGSNAANDGGLEFHTRNGGTGTDTMCMHMSHDARVGIRTTTPEHSLDVVGGDVQIKSTHARLFLTDTNHNPDWSVENENGIFRIKDQTAGTSRLTINSGGEVNVTNKVFLNGGLDTDGDVQFNTGTTNSNILFDASAGALEFTDGNKAVFGTDNDLEIYHDASANINKMHSQKSIENRVKNYYIYTNHHATAHEAIMAYGGGAVELTHAGTKKFETTSSGVDVTGTLVCDGFTNSSSSFFQGPIDANDNTRLRLGTSQDLQIYHDSSDSRIKNITNGLYIDSPAVYIRSDNGNEDSIQCIQNGAVNLYHNGGKKFETASYGALVSGNLQVNTVYPSADSTYDIGTNSTRFANGYFDTLYGDGSNLTGITTVGGSTAVGFNDGVKAKFGNSDDFQIYHSGSHAFLDNYTGHLYIRNKESGSEGVYCALKEGKEFGVFKHGTSEWLIKSVAGGSSELWYDGSKKFHTTSAGAYVTGAITSTGAGYINGTLNCQSSDDTRIRLNVPSGNGDDWNYISFYGENGVRDAFIGTWQDGTVSMYSDHGGQYIRFMDGVIKTNVSYVPISNNAVDLGTSSLRWRNVYTNDLNLSNEGSSNDVDGTWGDWTIQEGESNLFLKNNRSGKKYKFNLMEVS